MSNLKINTPETQERYGELKIQDLDSAASFRSWLKEHMTIHSIDEATDQHLLIYLNYIRERVDESDSVDSMLWKKAINKLESFLGGANEI